MTFSGTPISSSVPTATPVVMEQKIEAPSKVKEKTAEEMVKERFKNNPLMQKISWCESHFKQFNSDGSVHRGEINPDDVGLFQINTYYHLETAKKMEIDIFTPKGNMDYAEYLFTKEGSRPWNSSKGCWGREIAEK